jgi:Putative ATPase subunit of terminase (gpP-like)
MGEHMIITEKPTSASGTLLAAATMYADGWAPTEIATYFGVNVDWVNEWLATTSTDDWQRLLPNRLPATGPWFKWVAARIEKEDLAKQLSQRQQ